MVGCLWSIMFVDVCLLPTSLSPKEPSSRTSPHACFRNVILHLPIPDFTSISPANTLPSVDVTTEFRNVILHLNIPVFTSISQATTLHGIEVATVFSTNHKMSRINDTLHFCIIPRRRIVLNSFL